MPKRKRTREEGQALQARITETVEKMEAADPSRTPAKLEAQLQLASKQIADLERRMSNLGAGYRSDLSAEEGALSASSPAERRGMMAAKSRTLVPREDRWDDYRANLLVPRENPESWRNEPHESIPGVPEGSKLIGIPIRALESQYDVQIEVLEGDHDILKANTGLHVHGLGAAVLHFFEDLRST